MISFFPKVSETEVGPSISVSGTGRKNGSKLDYKVKKWEFQRLKIQLKELNGVGRLFVLSVINRQRVCQWIFHLKLTLAINLSFQIGDWTTNM